MTLYAYGLSKQCPYKVTGRNPAQNIIKSGNDSKLSHSLEIVLLPCIRYIVIFHKTTGKLKLMF